MITYPNQKILHINKPVYLGDFLTIGINEWSEASKILTPNTFKLYLYAAGNANGFDLALSRQAVINLLGISKDSYIRGVKELIEKGYIIHKQGNVYDFYTYPMCAETQTLDVVNDTLCAMEHTAYTQECSQDICCAADVIYAADDTEINKTNNINMNNNLATLDDDANASFVPYYVKRKMIKDTNEDKWAIKNSYQDSIFGSFLYTDKKIMELIKDIYEENGNEFTEDDIACDERFMGVYSDIALAYVDEVLRGNTN